MLPHRPVPTESAGLSLIYRLLGLLTLLAATISCYLFLARPYQLTWGASREEVYRSLPGDQLNPALTFSAARAITIDGTPRTNMALANPDGIQPRRFLRL